MYQLLVTDMCFDSIYHFEKARQKNGNSCCFGWICERDARDETKKKQINCFSIDSAAREFERVSLAAGRDATSRFYELDRLSV